MAPITPSTRKTSYAPVTPTTAFPVNFPLADNTDLKVMVNGVERTDFTVAATYPDGLSYDAVVNMNTAVTGAVVIYGQRIPRRQNQFQTGRPLTMPDLNAALNTLEVESQEARRDIDQNAADIAQEIVDRGDAVAQVQANLDAETAARMVADNDLQGNINTEAAIRSAADNMLQHNIDVETNQRIISDQAIASLIGQGGPIETAIFDTALAASFASIKPTVLVISTGGRTVSGIGGARWVRRNAEPSHDLKFVDFAGNGWWEIAEPRLNVQMAGAGIGGDDTLAFGSVARAVPAFDNVGSPWNAVPHPQVAEIYIPGGTYTLTSLVDTGNREITWVADQAANITGAEYLNGILRREGQRTTKPVPRGTYDQACGWCVTIGDNFADKPAPVLGVGSTQALADYSQRDAVAFLAANYAGPAILDVATATYTANTVTSDALTSEQLKAMRVGDCIYTKHATRCAGIVTGWNADGSTITVLEWRAKGGSAAVTPGDGYGFSIGVDKIWAINGVTNLESAGFATQAIGMELTMRNLKGAAPSTDIDDTMYRVWAYLAATTTAGTAGYYQCQTGFIARGDFFRGFTAHDQQVGYYARMTSAKIGFMYHGIGDALQVENRTNTTISYRLTYAGDVFMGQTTAAAGSGRLITFFTSGLNSSYDARIQATGGSAAAGNGTLTYLAIDHAFGGNIRPTNDNVRSCGTASFRWSQIYAANATISTSDETQKTAFRSLTDIEKEALLACRQHIGLFQWLDAVAEKGADVARIHAGVPAQTCIAEFTSRGLDPWRYAWFCRDKKTIAVTVTKTEQQPVMEDVEVGGLEVYLDGGVARQRRVTRIERRPKVTRVPLLDEAGNPVVDSTEDGGQFERFYEIQVTEEVEVETVELQETDEYVYSIRYTELTMALLAAVADG